MEKVSNSSSGCDPVKEDSTFMYLKLFVHIIHSWQCRATEKCLDVHIGSTHPLPSGYSSIAACFQTDHHNWRFWAAGPLPFFLSLRHFKEKSRVLYRDKMTATLHPLKNKTKQYVAWPESSDLANDNSVQMALSSLRTLTGWCVGRVHHKDDVVGKL